MNQWKHGIAAVAILLAACGENPAGTSTTVETTQEPAAEAASEGDALVFTEAELDAYVRGLRREIEAAQAAQRAAAAAATPAERGLAIQASWETATMPLGAAAAGLPVERYTELRNALDRILRTLDHQGKIDGPTSIDLEHADEATRARVARDPFADLPPASAAALRAKLGAVTAAWSEYVQLTAVAG